MTTPLMNAMAREPSGRPSRAGQRETAPAQAKRLRDAALRRMEAPEWGTELGRLFLENKIEPEHFEAGKRFATMIEAYRRATGANKLGMKAVDLLSAGRSAEPDPSSETGRRRSRDERSAMAAFEAANHALKSTGATSARAVHRICDFDEAPVGMTGLIALRIGLAALAHHLNLTARPRNGRSSR